jgi:hypothetical protein
MVSQTKRLVLGEFLIAAYDILKNNRFATCPVCEKPIDQAQVLQRLKERIEADRKFIGANNLVKSRKTLLLNSTV